MIRLIIFFLLIAITPVLASGQNQASCASTEAQKLNFLLGEWKVSSRFRLSKQPEQWEETQASSKITFLFEGCLLVEQFEGTRQRHPFKATASYAYDRNAKKYQWVGADSEHGVLTLYTGSLNGNDLMLESKVEISGQTVLLRRVWTQLASGGFSVQSQRSNDAGRTWDTAWHLTYRH